MKKIWFKRKTYGWGWTPVTWEGWTTVLVWLALLVFAMSKMQENSIESLIFVFTMVAFLLFISYKKGEPPCWQWGDKNKK